eukprot:scaffold264202_cov24-Prasinocladus_malaysianus.AAC.1
MRNKGWEGGKDLRKSRKFIGREDGFPGCKIISGRADVLQTRVCVIAWWHPSGVLGPGLDLVQPL